MCRLTCDTSKLFVPNCLRAQTSRVTSHTFARHLRHLAPEPPSSRPHATRNERVHRVPVRARVTDESSVHSAGSARALRLPIKCGGAAVRRSRRTGVEVPMMVMDEDLDVRALPVDVLACRGVLKHRLHARSRAVAGAEAQTPSLLSSCR